MKIVYGISANEPGTQGRAGEDNEANRVVSADTLAIVLGRLLGEEIVRRDRVRRERLKCPDLK